MPTQAQTQVRFIDGNAIGVMEEVEETRQVLLDPQFVMQDEGHRIAYARLTLYASRKATTIYVNPSAVAWFGSTTPDEE